MQKLVGVFKALEVDVLSRWRDTQRAVFASEHYKSDHELRELADLDMLLAFEDYNRVLERNFDDNYRKTEMERTMRERKVREGFMVRILSLLVSFGVVSPRSFHRLVAPPRVTGTGPHPFSSEMEGRLSTILQR